MTAIEELYRDGKFKGFALMIGDDSFEVKAISLFCTTHDILCKWFKKDEKIPEDFIPSGSVEWCESQLGFHPMPDYYPEWSQPFLHRKVWQSTEWLYEQRVFVKPADKYKRFTGFVKLACSYKGKKRPPYWYSEVVKFTNEWRYYVTHGNMQLGRGYWYSGDEVRTPEAPQIYEMTMPLNFCGCVDIGELEDGTLAVVEVQHPFACGWYGKFEDVHIYMNWLYHGWKFMNRSCK